MLRRFRPLSLLVLMCAALLAAGAAQAQSSASRGFMWEARKGESRVLLLGTIHVGRAGLTELTAQQAQRARDAHAVALEADVFDAQRTLAAFQRYAFVPADAPGLDRTLAASLRTRIEKLLPRYGLNPEAIWRLKPWAVANNLVVLEASRLGYSPAMSTEAQLFALTRSTGQPLLEIESVEKQLALFDSAPAELQLSYLEQAVASVESGTGEKEIRALIEAWSRSDEAAMSKRLSAMRESKNPGERWVSEQIIDGRHEAMLTAIDRFAASGKLHLVAVGTLHFFGGNGLLDGLRARGYSIVPLR